jgi:hypothetical protein
MSPDHQRQLNVERFEHLLEHERDPELRSRIAKLLSEERAKPDSAYPAHSLAGPRVSSDKPVDADQGHGA